MRISSPLTVAGQQWILPFPSGIHHFPYAQPLLPFWVGRYPESVVPVKGRFQLHAVWEKPANAGEKVFALEGLGNVIICPVQPTGFLCMVLPRVHLSHHDHWY